MAELVVRLKHPHRALRPNGRAHWAVKARAVKAARMTAWCQVKNALAMGCDVGCPSRYELVWFYKGAVPDADNCLAACKAYLDGCCDALGVDDRVLECAGIVRVHDLERAGCIELYFA